MENASLNGTMCVDVW